MIPTPGPTRQAVPRPTHEVVPRQHASVNGSAGSSASTWRTVWESIRPLLMAADADAAPVRRASAILGVDEHVVRHEALLFRMEVRDLHRLAVAAAG